MAESKLSGDIAKAMLPFESEPHAVNEEGTKFWLDKDTTNYARLKGLKDVVVFIFESKDGYQARCITENGKWLDEDRTLEGIGVKIDLLAFARGTDGKQTPK